MENGQQSFGDAEEPQPSPERLSDSIWKPWYAKLWWGAIPIYWLPASGPTGIELIDAFYRSKLFPYTSPFFLPLTAFLILAFGYLSRRLETAPCEQDFMPPLKRPWEQPGYLEPTEDANDPRSGWRWVHRRLDS
ncbi:hypothetical protein AB2M62_03320 [Sphingomonas sp. MMS12-HWE2-04]|uniref:hypothetical protein n=1 Tax=Sphingomonas sp. MMS12-HWE2-04 TaxID=3234199 RepID=UPI0038515883